MEKNRPLGGGKSGDDALIFGRRPVMEHLRSGRPVNRIHILAGAEGMPKEFFRLVKDLDIPLVRCDRKRLSSLVPKGNHQGVVAQVATRAFDSVQEILEKVMVAPDPGFILALDGVQDPHNFGALLRTAEGSGCHGVLISAQGSCGLTSAVSRASAGADRHMLVARCEKLHRQLETLAEVGYAVVAADPTAERVYFELDYSGPVVLVLGAEGRGLARKILEKCTERVTIPLCGQVDSLNVSVSGAVLMYEALRQRATRRRLL